jgi:hypothetical protein
MTGATWAADVGIFVTLLGLCTAVLRFYVRAILHELMPNSGNSLRDRIDKIEERQIHIYELLIANGQK